MNNSTKGNHWFTLDHFYHSPFLHYTLLSRNLLEVHMEHLKCGLLSVSSLQYYTKYLFEIIQTLTQNAKLAKKDFCFICFLNFLEMNVKFRPNEYHISYIIQLLCSTKCCTRLATLLYRVLSCCILLYEVDHDQKFFTEQMLSFLLFYWMLYDVVLLWPPHATLLYSVANIFEEMLYPVVRNVAFVWPPLR